MFLCRRGHDDTKFGFLAGPGRVRNSFDCRPQLNSADADNTVPTGIVQVFGLAGGDLSSYSLTTLRVVGWYKYPSARHYHEYINLCRPSTLQHLHRPHRHWNIDGLSGELYKIGSWPFCSDICRKKKINYKSHRSHRISDFSFKLQPRTVDSGRRLLPRLLRSLITMGQTYAFSTSHVSCPRHVFSWTTHLCRIQV